MYPLCEAEHALLGGSSARNPSPSGPERRVSLTARALLLRRGFALDKAFQALKQLVEHAVDLGRPLLHAATDKPADDIALRDIGATLGRFQRPAERPVDALHLQGAQRASQTQPLARCGVDNLQMLHRAPFFNRSQKQPPARNSILRLPASREKV